jgi:hypothetical protein
MFIIYDFLNEISLILHTQFSTIAVYTLQIIPVRLTPKQFPFEKAISAIKRLQYQTAWPYISAGQVVTNYN